MFDPYTLLEKGHFVTCPLRLFGFGFGFSFPLMMYVSLLISFFYEEERGGDRE